METECFKLKKAYTKKEHETSTKDHKYIKSYFLPKTKV